MLGENPTAKAALIRGKLRLAQFSRNQELEADAIGIKSSGQAGFDPFAAGRFLQSMSAYTDFRSVSGATDASLDFLASHPNAPQRIELAQRHARQFGAAGHRRARPRLLPRRHRRPALRRHAGGRLSCAATPSCIRGLGVSFSVPAGFVIDNSRRCGDGDGPGDMAIRFDGVALDQRHRR